MNHIKQYIVDQNHFCTRKQGQSEHSCFYQSAVMPGSGGKFNSKQSKIELQPRCLKLGFTTMTDTYYYCCN